MKHSLLARSTAVALLVCFAVWESIGATQGPTLPNPGTTSLTKEQQEQLGRKAMAEVYKQMPVLPDSSPETQYIRQLGQKLASVIPPQYSWPWEFHVIPQKDINAFALPGGPMFVNVGTITAADNEAELAGVMAHEMSHVYMQHSAKQMKQNTVPSILAGVGQVLGQMIGGVGGAIAAVGGQVGGGMLSMKFSRADEAQADAVGAIIMYKAGYNPKAMADFFQKLAQQGGSGPQFLSDHPNPGNREQAIQNEIASWPPKNYQVTSQAFQRAKQEAQTVKMYSAQQIADGAKSGEWARMNQQTGSIPKNLPAPESGNAPMGGGDITNVSYSQVRPSGNFKQLPSNSVLSMSYPDNWQAADQQGGGLLIAPPAGVGQSGIAYGVVINGGDTNTGSLDQATQQIVQGLQQSNPGLKATGSPQKITVNGLQGRSVELQGTSPIQGSNGQPERERDWLVTLPRPQGGLVYFVFIAPESQFGQLRPTYERMLKSVRLQ